jgi:DNA recombination protein RmuC
MLVWLVGFTAVLSLAGTILVVWTFLFVRGWHATQNSVTSEQARELLHVETDRVRQFGDDQARGLREELGRRLDGGIQTIGERTTAIGTKLDQDIARMGQEAQQNRDGLRQTIESALSQQGEHQKERLANVTAALSLLTEKQEKSSDALRQSVEARLDAIRIESAAKLEEMRKTVDEKLQSTLDTRLGESFRSVVEQLERVHSGIGEMQSMAANVGDLKKLLSNVRVRGTFGELHLGSLLEQFLSVEQFIRNAATKPDSQERVEFAIKLPGRDSESEVLLPIDSKFPQEDYERLLAAEEAGDAEKVAEASKALESRVKLFAKTISDKYINPPRTTNFAILFLPTESLYAEVLRRPGLFEQLQREHQVTLTGPTTFTALLNALQMGFRTLAIEKRSGEVWQILGTVQNEFGKYNKVVDDLHRQLTTAINSVGRLGTRTRAMSRELRNVEKLPDETAKMLLGDLDKLAEIEDEVEGPLPSSDAA